MFFAAVVAVAACTSTQAPLVAVPTPTPAPSSATVTTSTTTTVTIPKVTTTGVSLVSTLPVANVAASVTETISVSAPSGSTPLARGREDATATPAPIAYVELTSTSSVTLSAVPEFVFTLSSVTPGDSYYLAYFNGTEWITPADGPATVSGDTVTFVSIPGSIPITPSQPALAALYASSATPTPSPTPIPTPVASPSSLTLTAGGSAGTFTVSETGNSAAFASSISCTLNPSPAPTPTATPPGNVVATVSPASGTPASAGAAVTFTVTPGDESGACTVTVTDANSAAITIPVTVSTTNLSVYGKPRK